MGMMRIRLPCQQLAGITPVEQSVSDCPWGSNENILLFVPLTKKAVLEQNVRSHFPNQYSNNLAGTTGFEPAISGLTGQHVRPLHHAPEAARKSTIGV